MTKQWQRGITAESQCLDCELKAEPSRTWMIYFQHLKSVGPTRAKSLNRERGIGGCYSPGLFNTGCLKTA